MKPFAPPVGLGTSAIPNSLSIAKKKELITPLLAEAMEKIKEREGNFEVEKGFNYVLQEVAKTLLGSYFDESATWYEDRIKLLAVEEVVETLVSVPVGSEMWPIRMKGRIDRIDLKGDSVLRIVDYKTGKVVKKESPTASPEASKPMPVPKAPPPSVKAKMANELMPYLQFVEKHPVGSKVKAVVESYAANGITALIGDISGYVPLRNMANPQPRSARDIFTIGDSVMLTVVGYTPARRSVDLAVPGVVDAAVKPAGKPTVAKKVSPVKKTAVAKKVAPVKKTAPAKKAVATKTPAKKIVAAKAPAKKVIAVKKPAPAKAPVKKAFAKKAPAKKR